MSADPTRSAARVLRSFSNRGRVGPSEWTPTWLSYPRAFDNPIVQAAWKRTFCKGGVHLFDQVVSGGDRRLYCDACGCEVALR